MSKTHKIVAVAIYMREDQIDAIRDAIRVVGGLSHRALANQVEIDRLATEGAQDAATKIAEIGAKFTADVIRSAELADTLKPMFETARVIQPPENKGTIQ